MRHRWKTNLIQPLAVARAAFVVVLVGLIAIVVGLSQKLPTQANAALNPAGLVQTNYTNADHATGAGVNVQHQVQYQVDQVGNAEENSGPNYNEFNTHTRAAGSVAPNIANTTNAGPVDLADNSAYGVNWNTIPSAATGPAGPNIGIGANDNPHSKATGLIVATNTVLNAGNTWVHNAIAGTVPANSLGNPANTRSYAHANCTNNHLRRGTTSIFLHNKGWALWSVVAV